MSIHLEPGHHTHDLHAGGQMLFISIQLFKYGFHDHYRNVMAKKHFLLKAKSTNPLRVRKQI